MTTFWIEKIEWVQAVQNEHGSIPMIGGKPTFLRVFVGSDSSVVLKGSATTTSGSKTYNLTPLGLAAGDTLTSIHASIDRSRWDASFNFRIPDPLTAPGRITVAVSVAPADGSGAAHVMNPTIEFGPRIDLSVYGLVWLATDYSDFGWDYTYNKKAAPWSDFEAHRRFAENVFPVSSLRIIPLPGVGKAPPSPQPFKNLTQARDWAAAQLAKLPDRSVINILNNWTKTADALNGNTLGRVTEEENGREGWRIGVVMAQELAHAYGLPWHTFIPYDKGKPSPAGTPYPYGEDGPIGPDDYGVDLQGTAPTLVGKRYDIMSYTVSNTQKWISSFTYSMLLESITAAQDWHSLGGAAAVGPLRWCSWGPNRADLFARFNDGTIRHQFRTRNGWGLTGWENLGGDVLGGFDVASWGPDRIDIVARGTDGHLYHKWWEGKGWKPDPHKPDVWEPLGGDIDGSVVATSWGPGRLDVYARWGDGSVRHLFAGVNGWGTFEWENLGGVVDGPIAAGSWGPNRADVFARGTNGNVYHKWWDGKGWKPSGADGIWQDLGGPIDKALAVTASRSRVDLYARFPDSTTHHTYGTSHAFNTEGSNKTWENLGSKGNGDITAVAEGDGLATVIIAAVDPQAIVAHRWNGRSWTPTNVDWFDLNGKSTGHLSACSWGPGRIDVAAVGTDGAVYHKCLEGGRWGA